MNLSISAIQNSSLNALRGIPVFSALVVLALVLAAVFAPWVAPHDPGFQNFIVSLQAPVWQDGGSWAHPLGTDNLGRDILSRLIYGARLSLTIALFAILLAGTIGIALGLLAGYAGGIVDGFIMRVVDAFLAMPFILMALAIVAALGPSTVNIVVIMAITNWPRYARLVRGEVLSLKQTDFVLLARVAGLPAWKIALKHVLPNITNSILVLATLDIGRVIILESSLSFLGVGIQPPDVSWGLMLSDGRSYMGVAWWMTVMAGLAILISVLCVNVLGDWLRDRFDPRQDHH